jgi:division protein CdvB (Snf7/Vps24/ESCRT-III family)
MRESRESPSNITVKRDLHSLKQLLKSWTTDEGMEIDKSESQCQNAEVSMHET